MNHTNSIHVRLPETMSTRKDCKTLVTQLFPLHRALEAPYCSLPWPATLDKVVVWTYVAGGLGDLMAAAKAIAVMQRMHPPLHIEWVVENYTDTVHPFLFLACDHPEAIQIRNSTEPPIDPEPIDFLLTGPAVMQCPSHDFSKSSLEKRIQRVIQGPIVAFVENAAHTYPFSLQQLQTANGQPDLLHSVLFPSQAQDATQGLVSMGLQLGSGVFLDEARMQAPRSRGYCCPSYLLQIQEESLRQDILTAMEVVDCESLPDYDRYSFNFGYAHHPSSWRKFIDCVAMHEKEKNVVIVLNQRGIYKSFATGEFQSQIFTEDRIHFLTQLGYTHLRLQGRECLLTTSGSILERSLTVIVRPSFSPQDMQNMQLAAERLLATGDNSAVESWCALCKLYLYEDVANGGCKDRFLRQQVDLAKTLSPNLSRLLALFGGDRRLKHPLIAQSFTLETLQEVESLLNDPTLAEATLQFCQIITNNYSFNEVLEGTLKRAAWHFCLPPLISAEVGILRPFYNTFIDYVQCPYYKSFKLTLPKDITSKISHIVNDILIKI